MNMHEFTRPQSMEKYSFLWSEARLVIAAVALFLGGVPVLRAILPVPGLYGLISLILTLTWITSGLASAYLIYGFIEAKQRVFGGKDAKDLGAFFVSVISGVNLGLVGLTGTNVGMSIIFNKFIFILVGILYLAAAGYLYKRWQARGERVF